MAWVVPVYKNGAALWRAALSSVAPLAAAGVVRTNRTDRVIEFPGGGFLGMYSADNIDAIRGEAFHVVIVDEAARVSEEAYSDAILPTVADVGGDVILISTPRRKNWFYREWQRGRERMDAEVASFRAPSSDNPNPRIKRAAAAAAAHFGPDSNTYRQEWCAEFVTAGAVVWDRDWAVERYDPADELSAPRPAGRILSYDTGLKDTDVSAYSCGGVGELQADYRLRLRHVWRERLLFPNLVDRIKADIARWSPNTVLIEDKVSGTSAYQTLLAAEPELRPILVPFRPTQSKDERFEQAGVWLKNGMLLLPRPGERARWLPAFEMEIFEETEYMDQRDMIAQMVLWAEQRFLRTGLALRSAAAEAA